MSSALLAFVLDWCMSSALLVCSDTISAIYLSGDQCLGHGPAPTGSQNVECMLRRIHGVQYDEALKNKYCAPKCLLLKLYYHLESCIVADFVLNSPSKSELELLQIALKNALNIIPKMLAGETDKAMKILNTKGKNGL